ncbi:MAG: hypothetical protein HQL33_03680 [Alphaproteobacteria bacterium]|nr:hypothetical protein [Alphaproteobacteria bacterium]
MFRHAIICGVLLVAAAPLAQAAAKKPPACAAISFRPLATGALNEGDNRAGHYRSRFGSIDVIGGVKGGQVTGYRLEVNGKAVSPLKGGVPKSAHACLNAKHVKTPPKPIDGACVGERFRVVIDSSGEKKTIMLFGLDGSDWKLCEAGTPPG